MTPVFKPLAATLLCLAACAVQAQPVPAASTAARTTPAAPKLVVSSPGTFTSFKAMAGEVVAGKPLGFKFEGSGHCKLKLSGGDGYSVDLEGELPFSGVYVYGTGSMSSYDAFKNYTASATPMGNCKSGGPATTVTVKVVNPSPQGVSAPGNSNTNTVSSGKPGLTLKP